MYSLPVKVTSTYVGPDRTMSPSWFFRVFQDAALEDAENIGYGVDKTMGHGLLWVFSRVYVRFHRMPEYLEEVTFDTHPGAKKAFLFFRYGKMLDKKGETIAELSSVWALINQETRKVEMRPPLEPVDQTDGTELAAPGKVVAKPCSFRLHKTISYTDLDLNGHMNNVRYIEILMDLHDAEFYKKYRVEELLIQYESEIHEGEDLEVFVDDEATYVRGVVGDQVCFEANLKYALK